MFRYLLIYLLNQILFLTNNCSLLDWLRCFIYEFANGVIYGYVNISRRMANCWATLSWLQYVTWQWIGCQAVLQMAGCLAVWLAVARVLSRYHRPHPHSCLSAGTGVAVPSSRTLPHASTTLRGPNLHTFLTGPSLCRYLRWGVCRCCCLEVTTALMFWRYSINL